MNLNKKKCVVCKTEFNLYRSTQMVCSQGCAIKYSKKKNNEKVVAEKKQWLVKKKQWKSELETIPDLIKKVEKEFNRYIRYRDEFKQCISCEKKLGSIKQFHAGHYYSAGNYSNVRFNEHNVNGQCIECNLHLHGNQIEYQIGLEKKIGSDNMNALDNIARTKIKWDREQLNKILIIYKLKLKIIETERKQNIK